MIFLDIPLITLYAKVKGDYTLITKLMH